MTSERLCDAWGTLFGIGALVTPCDDIAWGTVKAVATNTGMVEVEWDEGTPAAIARLQHSTNLMVTEKRDDA